MKNARSVILSEAKDLRLVARRAGILPFGFAQGRLILAALAQDDKWWSARARARGQAHRGGIMLHYDDSSRDDWALEWFFDRRCTNGYTWLVLDDGHVIELADPALRTPHAGSCFTPKANSVFYGIAAATNGLVPATTRQLDSIAALSAAVLRHHHWVTDTLDQLRARIVGHDERRALWGTLGRKSDPTGRRADGRPIIALDEMRDRVHRIL